MSDASTPANPNPLAACVETLDIPRIERHLFLCADQTKPKCCPKDEGIAAWNYLKRRLKELELDRATAERPTCVFRTKANCLRVCGSGPILLVYPDRVWYRHATPEVIERVLQEHILGDRIVEDYVIWQPEPSTPNPDASPKSPTRPETNAPTANAEIASSVAAPTPATSAEGDPGEDASRPESQSVKIDSD